MHTAIKYLPEIPHAGIGRPAGRGRHFHQVRSGPDVFVGARRRTPRLFGPPREKKLGGRVKLQVKLKLKLQLKLLLKLQVKVHAELQVKLPVKLRVNYK